MFQKNRKGGKIYKMLEKCLKKKEEKNGENIENAGNMFQKIKNVGKINRTREKIFQKKEKYRK